MNKKKDSSGLILFFVLIILIILFCIATPPTENNKQKIATWLPSAEGAKILDNLSVDDLAKIQKAVQAAMDRRISKASSDKEILKKTRP